MTRRSIKMGTQVRSRPFLRVAFRSVAVATPEPPAEFDERFASQCADKARPLTGERAATRGRGVTEGGDGCASVKRAL